MSHCLCFPWAWVCDRSFSLTRCPLADLYMHSSGIRRTCRLLHTHVEGSAAVCEVAGSLG